MKPWHKVAVSVGLLAVLVFALPWHEVRDAITRLPAGVWLGGMVAFLAGHFIGVFKWRLLLAASRVRIGVVDAVRCYSAGLFANVCLPSLVGGDVLRAVMVGKASGHLEAAFLAGLADRLLDTAGLGVLIAVGGLFAGGALPGWSGQVLVLGIVLSAVALAAFLPLVLRRPLKKWPKKLRRPVGRGMVALRHLARRPGYAITAFLMSIGIQSGFVMLNVWLGRSMGIDLPIAVWFVAWPLAKVAGLVPISLGGLAVRDVTFGALLVPLGVPMARGVVAHLAWQAMNIGGGLIGGAVWWLLSRKKAAAGASTLRGLLALSPKSHG